MIEYKGYVGVFNFDPEIDAFHGTVTNTNDLITFYGTSITELRKEMKVSIEEYLAFCKEQGKEPEKPFSGKILIRTNPELHRRVAQEASRHQKSMNAFVQDILEEAISQSTP